MTVLTKRFIPPQCLSFTRTRPRSPSEPHRKPLKKVGPRCRSPIMSRYWIRPLAGYISSFVSTVRGSVFRFLVEKHQQPMAIHTVLVAEQSPALSTLVGGFMEEAQTGTAIWEEVDKDTFARWAQFVYTGDYPPRSCNIVTKPSTVANAARAGARTEYRSQLEYRLLQEEKGVEEKGTSY